MSAGGSIRPCPEGVNRELGPVTPRIGGSGEVFGQPFLGSGLARSRLAQAAGAIARAARAGADVFVAGTAVFGAPDYAQAIAALRQAALAAR